MNTSSSCFCMVLLSDDDYSGDEWCHLVGELLICIPRCPLFGKHSYCFWNCSLRSAWPSAMSEVCVHAKRAKPTFYLLEIFRRASALHNHEPEPFTSLSKSIFPAKDITAPIVHRLWRTIKHCVRAEPPLRTSLDYSSLFLGVGGLAAVTFGVTLRFICCVKSALLILQHPHTTS